MDDGGRRYEIEMKMRTTGQPEKQVWEGGKEEGTEEWVIEALVSGGWSGEITVMEKPTELHSIYYQRNGGKEKKSQRRGEGGAKQANKIPPIVHSLSVVMKQKTGLALLNSCWEDLLNKNEIN